MDKRQKEMVRCATHAILTLEQLKCDLVRDMTYAKEGGYTYTNYRNYINLLEDIDQKIRGLYEISDIIPSPKLGKTDTSENGLKVFETKSRCWPPVKGIPKWNDFMETTDLKGLEKDIASQCFFVSYEIDQDWHVFTFLYPIAELSVPMHHSIIQGFKKAFSEKFGQLVKIKLKCEPVDIIKVRL